MSEAADQLLLHVYNELRHLAVRRLAQELPGQTLQPTALVHEAYLRLIESESGQLWDSRGHFFVAAAEAMRRILVENARRKASLKHGGHLHRIELDSTLLTSNDRSIDLIQLNELLDQLAEADSCAAELVKLRFFAGLTGDQAAQALGVSPRKADMIWAYARAWLFERLQS